MFDLFFGLVGYFCVGGMKERNFYFKCCYILFLMCRCYCGCCYCVVNLFGNEVILNDFVWMILIFIGGECDCSVFGFFVDFDMLIIFYMMY